MRQWWVQLSLAPRPAAPSISQSPSSRSCRESCQPEPRHSLPADQPRNLNQEALELPLVPLIKHISNLRIREPPNSAEHVVCLRNELHIAILDPVVDHLDEVASAAGANEGDASPVLRLRGGLLEDVPDVVVRVDVAAGHERRPVPRALLPAGHAHPEVQDPAGRGLLDAALRVLVPLVAAVDDGVAGLEVGDEGLDGGVDGASRLDEEHDGAGASEGEHEPSRVAVAQHRERALVARADERGVHLGGGAVVDGDREALLGDVEREVLAHGGEAGEPDARGRGVGRGGRGGCRRRGGHGCKGYGPVGDAAVAAAAR
nr:unnamed protein product [Digitaria exilis]